MKKILFFLLFLLNFMLIGCSSSNELSEYDKINNVLINLHSYKCNSTITYISNKGKSIFQAKQGAEDTGRYKITTSSPKEVENCIILNDGKMIWQYNPHIASKFSVLATDKAERYELLLFSFLRNYTNSKDVALETGKIDESLCTVFEAIIQGNNKYLYSEKLWIDNETFSPVKLVIYDKEGKERIIEEFSNFEYNPKFENNYFVLDNTMSE